MSTQIHIEIYQSGVIFSRNRFSFFFLNRFLVKTDRHRSNHVIAFVRSRPSFRVISTFFRVNADDKSLLKVRTNGTRRKNAPFENIRLLNHAVSESRSTPTSRAKVYHRFRLPRLFFAARRNGRRKRTRQTNYRRLLTDLGRRRPRLDQPRTCPVGQKQKQTILR